MLSERVISISFRAGRTVELLDTIIGTYMRVCSADRHYAVVEYDRVGLEYARIEYTAGTCSGHTVL